MTQYKHVLLSVEAHRLLKTLAFKRDCPMKKVLEDFIYDASMTELRDEVHQVSRRQEEHRDTVSDTSSNSSPRNNSDLGGAKVREDILGD